VLDFDELVVLEVLEVELDVVVDEVVVDEEHWPLNAEAAP
jgi:hypothetical protein